MSDRSENHQKPSTRRKLAADPKVQPPGDTWPSNEFGPLGGIDTPPLSSIGTPAKTAIERLRPKRAWPSLGHPLSAARNRRFSSHVTPIMTLAKALRAHGHRIDKFIFQRHIRAVVNDVEVDGSIDLGVDRAGGQCAARRVHQAASLLGHPCALKVMENLAEPDSASGLARRFGVPRQVLNYHLRALEAAGLVQFVAERPRGGLRKGSRRSKDSTHAYLISPRFLERSSPIRNELRDRFSWYLVAAAAKKIVRDAGTHSPVGKAPTAPGKKLATFTIETEVPSCLGRRPRRVYSRELSSKIAELAVRYHDAHAPHERLFHSPWVRTRQSPRSKKRTGGFARLAFSSGALTMSTKRKTVPYARTSLKWTPPREACVDNVHGRWRRAHPLVLHQGKLRDWLRRRAAHRLGWRAQRRFAGHFCRLESECSSLHGG